jgi:Domain of unknown function (DUF5979)
MSFVFHQARKICALILLVFGASSAVAATVAVRTTVAGGAYPAGERFTASITCQDQLGSNVLPSNGSSLSAAPGQTVEFLNIPNGTYCTARISSYPQSPAGYLLTSTQNFQIGFTLTQSVYATDYQFTLRQAISVPVTLTVLGEPLPANSVVTFSASCNAESFSRSYTGSIAPSQEVRIPDVPLGASCQAFVDGPSVNTNSPTLQPFYVIATRNAFAQITTSSSLAMSVGIAKPASIKVNVTSDLANSSSTLVSGQFNCVASNTVFSGLNRNNFYFTTGDIAVGASKTLTGVPSGLECSANFSSPTSTNSLKPAAYTPGQSFTVGAPGSITTFTAAYNTDTPQFITLTSSFGTSAPPAGVTYSVTYFCSDNLGRQQTVTFTNMALTGTVTSTSRVASGLTCQISQTSFAPARFAGGVFLREPTFTPANFVTSASTATTVQITHRPVAADATISVKATISGGTLPTGSKSTFSLNSCYYLGEFLPGLPSVDVLLSGTVTPLATVPAGTTCQISSTGLPSQPAGFLWAPTSNWQNFQSVSAVAGQNLFSYDATLLPETVVTVNLSTIGLPTGSNWTFSNGSPISCNLNGAVFAPSIQQSATQTTPQISLTVPTGSTCTLLPVNCCSVYGPSGYAYIPAPAQTFTASSSAQSVGATLRFAKLASLEISATVVSSPTAGEPSPQVSGILSCDGTFFDLGFNFSSSSKALISGTFNISLVEGQKCRLSSFRLSSSNTAPSGSNWFTDSEGYDITLSAGLNQFSVPLSLRKAGTFTYTVNASPQVAANTLFYPSIQCAAAANMLYESYYGTPPAPIAFPNGFSGALALGQVQAGGVLPAGAVCRQTLTPNAGALPAAGYAWAEPLYSPGRTFTIVSEQTITVTATPQTVGSATVGLTLNYDDPSFQSTSFPRAKLLCKQADGSERVYLDGGTSFVSAGKYLVAFSNIPSGAICRAVSDGFDVDNILNAEALLPATTLVAGQNALSATLIYRPKTDLTVNVVELGGATTSGVFYPTIVCSASGYASKPTLSVTSPTTVGSDVRSHQFTGIPATSRCIVSLQRYASADSAAAFTFAALPQTVLVSAPGLSVTMTSRVYPSTSIVVSLPATGVPAGSTSVQVKCTVQGAGLENWVGTRAAAPVGGSVTVTNVPAGASCSVVIAGADLPRPPEGTQWAQASYSSGTFVPNAAGTTKVSINLDTVSVGKPTALADEASGQPIPALSWESLLALLGLMSGLAYAGLGGRRRW